MSALASVRTAEPTPTTAIVSALGLLSLLITAILVLTGGGAVI